MESVDEMCMLKGEEGEREEDNKTTDASHIEGKNKSEKRRDESQKEGLNLRLVCQAAQCYPDQD